MDFAELSSLHLFPASSHNEFCATCVHLTWRHGTQKILGRHFYLVTPINCSRLVLGSMQIILEYRAWKQFLDTLPEFCSYQKQILTIAWIVTSTKCEALSLMSLVPPLLLRLNRCHVYCGKGYQQGNQKYVYKVC